jgi:hypothetical protein
MRWYGYVSSMNKERENSKKGLDMKVKENTQKENQDQDGNSVEKYVTQKEGRLWDD